MKLRSLAVNQFKKFTVPTQLDGMADGLNLVVGPNEMGKSTLLDALRAVLFERYTSRARAITELQNDRSGAAPVVEAMFELDEGSYTIAKRFIKSPYARLDCPDGRRLEGDAAEAMLRDLLGFSESAGRGASPESLGMWGVLWVQQGHSFGAPELPGSARVRLGGILESEVGDVLGGRRGRELPQIIQQRLADWLTPAQSRPRGDYKAARGRSRSAGGRTRGAAHAARGPLGHARAARRDDRAARSPRSRRAGPRRSSGAADRPR